MLRGGRRPAGMALGLALARAGVTVTALDKHGDFHPHPPALPRPLRPAHHPPGAAHDPVHARAVVTERSTVATVAEELEPTLRRDMDHPRHIGDPDYVAVGFWGWADRTAPDVGAAVRDRGGATITRVNRLLHRDRTLEDLEDSLWPAPGPTTSLVERVHALRRKPIGTLTIEDLADTDRAERGAVVPPAARR